jgi:choline dehydrogenase-like flavoprotein
VVIGSGYGGAISAARLAQAGFQVLVLERGPRLTASDFRQSDDPRYLQTVVDVVVSGDNVAFRTGCMVGGASIPLDGAHFRTPAASFDATDSRGRRVWPSVFSRAALDPYYERVESMMSIRQLAWTEIPRAGGLFAKMLRLAGGTCERARMNYAGCLNCGFCAQGCIFEKKRTMFHTYLPAAIAAGAEVRPGCDVHALEPSGTGYDVHYVQNGQMQTVHGARVVVAGGGIHTPALLLRSPLPNLSDQVGQNFNNNGEHPIIGVLPPDFDDLDRYRCYMGMDNSGMMSFAWYDSDKITLHSGGGFEPSLFASAIAAAGDDVLPARAWGFEYKRFVEEVYPHRVIAGSVLGLADGFRRIVLRDDGTPDLTVTDRTAFDAYLDRVEGILADIARASVVRVLPAVARKYAGQTSAHLLGACRVADSPADGVIDPDGQVFGHENLWICDASAVPYALAVNPSLTISAPDRAHVREDHREGMNRP